MLQARGVPCTIYEREPSPAARTQGGSLDLHAASGQRALVLAGLTREFIAIARPEGDDHQIAGKDGRVYLSKIGPRLREGAAKRADRGCPRVEHADGDQPLWEEGTRPEVDRGTLRQIFVDSLAPGTIKWGHKLQCVLPGAPRRLVFVNGYSTAADLVVGADGAWSAVRPALSPARPKYTGVTFVETQINDIDTRFPELGELVGQGSFMAIDVNKGILAQRSADARVRSYVALRVPECWPQTSGFAHATDPALARAQLLALFPDWAPQLRRLVDVCENTIVPRPLYKLPVGHMWPHRPGFTVRLPLT